MKIYTATVNAKPLAVFNAVDDATARDYIQSSDLKIDLFGIKSGGERLRNSGDDLDFRPATPEETKTFWDACRSLGPPDGEDDHVNVILSRI